MINDELLEKFTDKLEEWVDQYTHDRADSPTKNDYFRYFQESKEFYIFLEEYRDDIELNIKQQN